MRIRTLLITLLLGVSLAPGAVAAVGDQVDGLPPGLGIRVADVPVEDRDDPRANQYIVGHLIPGAALQRRILVSNGTDEALPVTMRGVTATATDGWLVDDTGAAPAADQLAAWISVEPSTFTLAPHSVLTVEVTILVPGGVPDGERYAVVVAEPPPVDAGGGIGVVSRVGTRVYLSVGGDEPVTEFEIDTLTASRQEDGTPVVDVGILNTGGRAIDVSGSLELVSVDGLLSAGPFPTSLPGTLGPSTRGGVRVALPADLSAGPWVVTATMRSGLVERRAQATLRFPAEPGETADPVTAERLEAQRRALLPIAALLLAAAALLLWLLWRKQRDEADEDGPDVQAGPAAAVGTVERSTAG